MPSVSRKRKSDARYEDEAPPTQRRRTVSPDSDASDAEDPSSSDAVGNVLQSLINKLVRLALATEVTRQPLRRTDISAKVLAPDHGRAFRKVLAGAQEQLRKVFGMTLVELPTREKVTIQQKRAAQKTTGNTQGSNASSGAYILTSILPKPYRKDPVLHTSRAPGPETEANYTALYSTVVAVIYLNSGHRVSDSRLLSYLRTLGADEEFYDMKTENLLKRMEKEGYIVKIKEREVGGEETVEWVVGPRGKVEIGERGVAGFVKSVYSSQQSNLNLRGLEDQLEAVLGAGSFKRSAEQVQESEAAENGDEGGDEERENEGSDAENATATQNTEAGPSNSRTVNRASRRPAKAATKSTAKAAPSRSSRRNLVVEEADGSDDDEEDEEEDENEEEDEDEEEE